MYQEILNTKQGFEKFCIYEIDDNGCNKKYCVKGRRSIQTTYGEHITYIIYDKSEKSSEVNDGLVTEHFVDK